MHTRFFQTLAFLSLNTQRNSDTYLCWKSLALKYIPSREWHSLKQIRRIKGEYTKFNITSVTEKPVAYTHSYNSYRHVMIN